MPRYPTAESMNANGAEIQRKRSSERNRKTMDELKKHEGKADRGEELRELSMNS